MPEPGAFISQNYFDSTKHTLEMRLTDQPNEGHRRLALSRRPINRLNEIATKHNLQIDQSSFAITHKNNATYLTATASIKEHK